MRINSLKTLSGEEGDQDPQVINGETTAQGGQMARPEKPEKQDSMHCSPVPCLLQGRVLHQNPHLLLKSPPPQYPPMAVRDHEALPCSP